MYDKLKVLLYYLNTYGAGARRNTSDQVAILAGPPKMPISASSHPSPAGDSRAPAMLIHHKTSTEEESSGGAPDFCSVFTLLLKFLLLNGRV